MARKGNKRATAEITPKATETHAPPATPVMPLSEPSVAPAAPQEHQPAPAGVTIRRANGMVIVQRTS